MIPNLVVAALQFYRDPHSFTQITQPATPLPTGITDLLAAPGKELSEENLQDTANALGATEEECREIVAFFIKQVMLVNGADHYRKLGVSRDADPGLIRQHYHYLMRLFHPDRDSEGDGWDDLYAPRINEAYNILKNPTKRAEYDAELDSAMGFSPEQLRRNSPGPSTYRAAAPVTASLQSAGLSPRAKVLAVGVGLLILIVFATLVNLQSNRPTLEVTAKLPSDVEGNEPNTGGAREDLFIEGARVSLQDATAEVSEPPVNDETASKPRPKTDAEIEALIQQRLERATRAVLGPAAARRRTESMAVQSAVVPDSQQRATLHVAEAESDPINDSQHSEKESRERPPGPARQEDTGALKQTVATTEIEPAPNTASVDLPKVPERADAIGELDSVEAAPLALPAIDDAQLTALLADFSRYYEAGDVEAFVTLFADKIVTTETRGKAALHRDYQEFFSRPQERRIRFHGMQWEEGLLTRSGGGRVDVSTRSTRTGERTQAQLRIDLKVESLEDGIKITGMYYE